MSPSLQNLGSHETIKFGRVITNQGYAYDPSNGIYTVPITRTYVLFSSLLTKRGTTLESDLRVVNQENKNGNKYN